MTKIQLFAVTKRGVKPLPIPSNATDFADLYDGLPLGVYSALRTYDHNKFLGLEEHLARTERSMAMLGWEDKMAWQPLRRALHEVCTAYPAAEARVRFDVMAEPAAQLGTDSRVLIALLPLTPVPPHFYEEGVAVKYARDLARERPLAKTADFVQKRRGYAVGKQEAYEYLLLNQDGFILEGISANFYGICDGAVYTAGEGVLEGITRKMILALLPELDIPVRLEPIHMSDVARLDEAAISSSSRAFLPVVRIEEQMIGNGRPGPFSQCILAAYQAWVQRSIQTAV